MEEHLTDRQLEYSLLVLERDVNFFPVCCILTRLLEYHIPDMMFMCY